MRITTLFSFLRQLLACAAERRAAAPLQLSAGRAAIDRYILPTGRTAANPHRWSAAGK